MTRRTTGNGGTALNLFGVIAIHLVILAIAIALTVGLLPGVHFSGGVFTYIWVALILAVVNAVLGPLLHLIALPLTVLTLGLFALVVNAGLLAITAGLSSHLAIDGFWDALFAALLISVFSGILSWVVRKVMTKPAQESTAQEST
jgi:putative membrane protein